MHARPSPERPVPAQGGRGFVSQMVGRVGADPTTLERNGFTDRRVCRFSVPSHIGGPDVIRTRYIYLARVALSQLSYGPIFILNVYIRNAIDDIQYRTMVYIELSC